jgi:hypothetical protein
LVEYAINTDPNTGTSPANAPRPVLTSTSAIIALVYRKNLAATDVTYTVMGSPDLLNWTPVPVTESTLSTVGQTREIKATPTGQSPRFLRLKLTLVP